MALRKTGRTMLGDESKDKAITKVKALLGTHTELMLSMQRLVEQEKKIREQVETLMKSEGLEEVTDGVATATYAPKKGKTTRTVIVDKFRKLVSEKDFMESVSVTITAASAILGEKELNKCVKSVEGKDGPAELVIKANKKKK